MAQQQHALNLENLVERFETPVASNAICCTTKSTQPEEGV